MDRLNRGYPDSSTEAVDWNHCTYQFPTLFSVIDLVNVRHEYFFKTIESVHRGGGDV